jgi:hypothetical protein
LNCLGIYPIASSWLVFISFRPKILKISSCSVVFNRSIQVLVLSYIWYIHTSVYWISLTNLHSLKSLLQEFIGFLCLICTWYILPWARIALSFDYAWYISTLLWRIIFRVRVNSVYNLNSISTVSSSHF